MKSVKSFGLSLLTLALVAAPLIGQAKEVELALQVHSHYPMAIHYRVSNQNTVFGQGHLKHLSNAKHYYIYVNRIPDQQPVLVQVDKMTVGNRTEINDPCEVQLPPSALQADTTIGFKGNPKTHGSFTCFVKQPSLKKHGG